VHGLVDKHQAATSGDGNIRNLPPTLVLNLTADHVFLQQRLTNARTSSQIRRSPAGRSDQTECTASSSGGKLEKMSQSAPASTWGNFEHIPKESAIRRRVCAIDNGLCNGNQSIYYIYGTVGNALSGNRRITAQIARRNFSSSTTGSQRPDQRQGKRQSHLGSQRQGCKEQQQDLSAYMGCRTRRTAPV